jgi:hypothetical protein
LLDTSASEAVEAWLGKSKKLNASTAKKMAVQALQEGRR